MTITEEQIKLLRQKGLTCSKLRTNIRRQMQDSKKARKDAQTFRNLGINSQAELQEKIAKAEEQSANSLRRIRKRLCPLR